MAKYMEYTLDDGSKILIEVSESEGGAIPATNRKGVQIIEASTKLEESLPSLRNTFKAVLDEFNDLHIDEAEIKFGMSVVGEAGVVAIAKIGGEVNFEITM